MRSSLCRSFLGSSRRMGRMTMATSTGGHGQGNQAFFHSEIDVLYSRITSTAGYRFFEAGFGFEPNSEYGDLPSFHQSVGEMAALVADEGVVPEIRMNRVGASAESALSALTALSTLYSRDLDAPRIYEARFDTPVGSTYTLLPAESKRAVAQYVTVPAGRGAAKATVVHLAATGDHGFTRRLLAYALPLATHHNIASIILESPFYGFRRPEFQHRSKLRTLSDLMLLGKATIEESLYLVKWLARNVEGGAGNPPPCVVSGVSMGGVHACMVASMYGVGAQGSGVEHPPLGVVPLLAPKSASGAYCRGALKMSTSWEGLGLDLLSANRDLRGLLGRISRDMEHGPVLSRACDRSWKILERLTAFAEDRGKTPSTSRQEKLVFDLVELILNTYTDLTRFPKPPNTDAAVVVGGSDDGYVGTESVRDVGAHLTGSDVRWVNGGHVSSFLLQGGTFVTAMADCVDRLVEKQR